MAIKMTFSKAVKFKCIDCCGGCRAEVRRCTVRMCSLWPFRPGARTKGEALEAWTAEFEAEARKHGDIRANEGAQEDDDEGTEAFEE